MDPRLKELKESITKTRGRLLKRRLKRAEKVSLKHAHRFIVGRFSNLRDVQRNAIMWVIAVGVLIVISVLQTNYIFSKVSVTVASEGGVFSEGTLGDISNLNPIFITSQAERAGSRLLFANLLTYDDKGDLVGELAETWGPDKNGKVYTLVLKQNAKWQDGVPITADDVVFTFDTIKNADVRSPLYSNWRNVGVERVNDKTVRFKLASSHAAFESSLVIGMLPKHILGAIKPAELRTAEYNRAPKVASGVFRFQDLQTIDQVAGHHLLDLTANDTFVMGAPKLDGFQLHAYRDNEDLVKAFRTHEIAGFSGASRSQLKALPKDSFVQTNSPLFNGVYAFLNNQSPVLNNQKVRTALKLAISQEAIIKRLDSTVAPLNGPLVAEQLSRPTGVSRPNITRAAKLLDSSGWKLNKQGKRQKGKEVMRLSLRTISSGDYPVVAEEVLKQWSALGVEFDSQLIRAEDAQQSIILPRAYDILIYEIALGRDPDVFAYWHSSQAGGQGLNLSNYNSPTVDDALDSARSRLEPRLRAIKYDLFARQWNADVPAVPLYRPTLSYVQNHSVLTFKQHPLVDAVDRYFNVRYWAAGQEELRITR